MALDRSVEDLLEQIEGPNRQPAKQFWNDLQQNLPKAHGSTRAHHAWDYGYRHHVQEIMNLATELHSMLAKERELPFTVASALLVLFLHDCEKPFRYASDDELRGFSWIKARPAKSDKNFQGVLLGHYGFSLSADELNGLAYVEGENDDYVEGQRVQGPLAAFCHICDVVSARIWFDQPEH